MAKIVQMNTVPSFNPLHLVRQSWKTNPFLTLLGSVMLIALVGTLPGLIIDQRVITGAAAWLKPMKFAISISVYAFTLVWLLQFVQRRPRLVRFVSASTMLILLVEMVIVVLQVVRGTTSHFNVSTPFDANLYTIMGIAIALLWLVTLLVVILVLFQRFNDPAFALSLRLGVILVLAGMSIGFLMTTQLSPSAKASVAAGHLPSTVGAHSVGVNDGGPGLPIVGWSTTGGDLRIAHFFGLHALQILPLLGWLVIAIAGRMQLAKRSQVALIWIAGLAYASWLALLTWQALRGQSIIAPDALTLTVFVILIGATVLSTCIVLFLTKRQAIVPII